MANGDITAVKILYRQSLGGGQDASGLKKNSKILSVGEITATYVSTGISAAKAGGDCVFGMAAEGLDFVKLIPYSVNGVYSLGNALQTADYDVSGKLIFVATDIGAANPTVPTDGHSCIIRFVAVGNDADAPELT